MEQDHEASRFIWSGGDRSPEQVSKCSDAAPLGADLLVSSDCVVNKLTLYSPFISSPVFWPGLACFNSPVYYGGYPLIFLTEYIKFDSYSPNGDSSRIRQVTDFWFSKKARKWLHFVYGNILTISNLATFSVFNILTVPDLARLWPCSHHCPGH